MAHAACFVLPRQDKVSPAPSEFHDGGHDRALDEKPAGALAIDLTQRTFDIKS
jgi:hypothetical protein